MNSVLDNSLFEAFATSSDNVYVYVTDGATGATRFSKNAVDFFEFPGEYMDNILEVLKEKIHPEDAEGYFTQMDQLFRGEIPRHDYQYRMKNKYGEYSWIECKGSLIFNGSEWLFAGLMTRLDNQNKYDSVTGLSTIYDFYNYDFSKGRGYLLLVGIDQFRKVVSSYGYSFGDRVLVEFSKNLREIAGDKYRVYRMSGDEFIVILSDTDKETVKQVFDQIKEKSDDIIIEDGRKLQLSVSAGACRYPDDGTDKETLLNNLEHSLEYRKSTRRGSIAFFSSKIAESHIRIQKLKNELKQSINNDFKGFELYFQPIVDSVSDRIIGCEALLRWKGETIKDSNPGEFIKILEDDGDILPVGRWVMEQAVKQQSIWNEKYPDFKVSFNVSYQQFVDDDFADSLFSAINKYNVKPSNMIVELTESCKVEEADELAGIFAKLKSEGFNVALDDFGTAYASLEMLKKLPASVIKIEHSFVRELTEPGHEIDYIIIENLLALCRRIDCSAIVEGVENEKVAEMIRELDSTFLQGYYYSRPVSRTEFEKMVEEKNK